MRATNSNRCLVSRSYAAIVVEASPATVENRANRYRTAALTLTQGDELCVNDVPTPPPTVDTPIPPARHTQAEASEDPNASSVMTTARVATLVFNISRSPRTLQTQPYKSRPTIVWLAAMTTTRRTLITLFDWSRQFCNTLN